MARLGGYVHIATLFLERLRIEPVTLGGHRRSFAEGTITAAFKVTESTVTSKGVIIVNYERTGQSQP